MRSKILNLEVGHSIDWKFGLITREIYRVSNNKFEITDMSSGWITTNVTKQQMIDLLDDKLRLTELNWN